METFDSLPVPKGAPKEMERDLGKVQGEAGKEGMASHWQKAGLGGILGSSS